MKHLDLFSGIGGFALAVRRAGWETVAFCEIDEFCQKVLAKNWPDVPIFSDVRKLYRFATDQIPCPDCDEPFCVLCEQHFWECQCIGCSEFDDEVGQIDIITGGFPCQDISVGHTWDAAKGLAGKRSGLWSEIVRLTDALRPKWVVAENVAALRSRGLTQCLQDLWSVGYDCEWHIIPASAVGAVHKRERIWIIANPAGERVERLWPEGFPIPRSLDEELLSVRDCNGKWKSEPDLRRANDGISNRVDRLKSLGNAIVPTVAERVFSAIKNATHD